MSSCRESITLPPTGSLYSPFFFGTDATCDVLLTIALYVPKNMTSRATVRDTAIPVTPYLLLTLE